MIKIKSNNSKENIKGHTKALRGITLSNIMILF